MLGRTFASIETRAAAIVAADCPAFREAASAMLHVNELAKICSGENYLAPLKGSRKRKRETDRSTSAACIFSSSLSIRAVMSNEFT